MELIMKFMCVLRNGVNHEIHVCVCCSTRLHRSGARSDIKENPGDSCVDVSVSLLLARPQTCYDSTQLAALPSHRPAVWPNG